ncbi:DUF262 domain-containing protein [Aeromonas caviae]|uniref:DUF262 domain-containing protein n=1 Tax=Aeromonas caviae TaxID=648 RepID=UPI002B4A74A3|nr:DUF262 domain-containing protein [Aeromonas caviae]
MSNNSMNDEYREELSESGYRVGVESDDEEETILEPFDPDSISIEQKVVPMDTLIRRLRQGSIHLSPSFQRDEVWDLTRRSRLIESLMLKVPLPMFYVAADENGKWEVVDGLQRLSTIRDFILGDKDGIHLVLKNLEFLGEKLNGKTYISLEKDVSQQRLINSILETEMRFTVINPGTPEAVKRNIFKRINTGGMPLTSQEIRHALYQGKSSLLLSELAKCSEFSTAVGSKINDTRMAARELILRFISFYIFDRDSFKSNMDAWLSNTMRVINLMPSIEPKELFKIFKNDVPNIKTSSLEDIKYKFTLSMKRSNEIFNGHAFRKSLPDDLRKTPINKSLFEVWANVLAALDDTDYAMLLTLKPNLMGHYKKVFDDSFFVSAISRHSSAATSVQYRYKVINDIIYKTLNGEEV